METAKTVMVSAALAMGLRQPALNEVGTPGNGDVMAARADADKNLINPASSSQEHPHDKHHNDQPIAAGGGTQGVEYSAVDLTVCQLRRLTHISCSTFFK
jgi:hypothetical protein